ncbi:MAG: YihA family ribosome biogenesis GTP-binding protein [Bacteroidota bacterium]|nr:YihA family ribosome biogenesis GTP-binding protein [Bacteroidota bacterium]
MKIKKAIYLLSSPDFGKCPPPDRPEFAFIGRSNVGKSSLINMLCQNEKLAKISNTPGKTQMINHFEVTSAPDGSGGRERKWYLVDLPGYGFAKVSQSSRRRWEQMIENYLRKRENLLQVFVLVDSRHTPQKIDLEFLEKMKHWEIPVTLVFTKTDKVNQATVSRHISLMLESLRKTHPFLPRHIVTSSEKGLGRDKILDLIEEINQDHGQ